MALINASHFFVARTLRRTVLVEKPGVLECILNKLVFSSAKLVFSSAKLLIVAGFLGMLNLNDKTYLLWKSS